MGYYIIAAEMGSFYNMLPEYELGIQHSFA